MTSAHRDGKTVPAHQRCAALMYTAGTPRFAQVFQLQSDLAGKPLFRGTTFQILGYEIDDVGRELVQRPTVGLGKELNEVFGDNKFHVRMECSWIIRNAENFWGLDTV